MHFEHPSTWCRHCRPFTPPRTVGNGPNNILELQYLLRKRILGSKCLEATHGIYFTPTRLRLRNNWLPWFPHVMIYRLCWLALVAQLERQSRTRCQLLKRQTGMLFFCQKPEWAKSDWDVSFRFGECWLEVHCFSLAPMPGQMAKPKPRQRKRKALPVFVLRCESAYNDRS